MPLGSSARSPRGPGGEGPQWAQPWSSPPIDERCAERPRRQLSNGGGHRCPLRGGRSLSSTPPRPDLSTVARASAASRTEDAGRARRTNGEPRRTSRGRAAPPALRRPGSCQHDARAPVLRRPLPPTTALITSVHNQSRADTLGRTPSSFDFNLGHSVETARRYALPTEQDRQAAIERLLVDG